MHNPGTFYIISSGAFGDLTLVGTVVTLLTDVLNKLTMCHIMLQLTCITPAMPVAGSYALTVSVGPYSTTFNSYSFTNDYTPSEFKSMMTGCGWLD